MGLLPSYHTGSLAESPTSAGGGASWEVHGGGDGGYERWARAMVLRRHRAAIGAIGDGAGEGEKTPALELQSSPRPTHVLLRGLNARWEVRRRRKRGRRRGCRSKGRHRRRRVDVGNAKARPNARREAQSQDSRCPHGFDVVAGVDSG